MKYLIIAILLSGCAGYASEPAGCEEQWDAGYDAATTDAPEKIIEVKEVVADTDLLNRIEELEETNANLNSVIIGLRDSLLNEREINGEALLRCETDRLNCESEKSDE